MKEPAFEDITLESERKRIFKDFIHVLEVIILFFHDRKVYRKILGCLTLKWCRKGEGFNRILLISVSVDMVYYLKTTDIKLHCERRN